MTVVTPSEAGTGGLGLTIIYLVAYSYSNDGLLALTQLKRLKRAFDFLTSLFDHAGLRKNMKKTVSMACQTCHDPGQIYL